METTASSVRNRLWLVRYSKAISVVGILMLIVGIAYGVIGAFTLHNESTDWLLAHVLGFAGTISLTGFLALGLASLLRYVLGAKQQPGWVLKHTEMGLYLLAALRLANCAFLFYLQAKAFPKNIPVYRLYTSFGLSFTMTVTSALILVALGLVLRRALPILEESRTLV